LSESICTLPIVSSGSGVLSPSLFYFSLRKEKSNRWMYLDISKYEHIILLYRLGSNYVFTYYIHLPLILFTYFVSWFFSCSLSFSSPHHSILYDKILELWIWFADLESPFTLCKKPKRGKYSICGPEATFSIVSHLYSFIYVQYNLLSLFGLLFTEWMSGRKRSGCMSVCTNVFVLYVYAPPPLLEGQGSSFSYFTENFLCDSIIPLLHAIRWRNRLQRETTMWVCTWLLPGLIKKKLLFLCNFPKFFAFALLFHYGRLKWGNSSIL